MTDPLDALRSPVVPVAPDPRFAARLRRRLETLEPAVTDPRPEDDMPETPPTDAMSPNGSRHGDVSYVTLALEDAAAGRRFYGRVLGWEFAAGPRGEEGNQAAHVIPQVGLWPAPAWRQGVTAGAILSWRVDDIAGAVEAVRAAGGTATDAEQLPYGMKSECTDGRGLRFWLHQLPPPGEAAPRNGGRQGDISYVVLRVADLAAAQRFFARVLGWRFAPGASGVHVEGPVPMTGMTQGDPGVTLCYRVDDIGDSTARVAAAGGSAGEIGSRPYGLESLCRDDQGVQFYLHQLT